MPYDIKKGSGPRPWKIIKKDTGEVVGSSTSEASARASIRARHAVGYSFKVKFQEDGLKDDKSNGIPHPPIEWVKKVWDKVASQSSKPEDIVAHLWLFDISDESRKKITSSNIGDSEFNDEIVKKIAEDMNKIYKLGEWIKSELSS